MSDKIIVDDDWKAQVEKEKQLAAQASARDQSSSAASGESPVSEAQGSAGQGSAAQGSAAPGGEVQSGQAQRTPVPGEDAADLSDLPAPPDASFETLLTMLFTQGMAALGQLPGDNERPLPVNKPFAKHFIDTIEMLGEKTKGNLSSEESTMLNDVLHAMRMAFVSIKPTK